MMSKFNRYIFCLLFIISSSALAQTEKRTQIYGGGLSMQGMAYGYGSAFLNIAFNPLYGYFPVNNFAIIGKMNFSYGQGNYYYSTGIEYGLGPELRYYVGGEKVKFFVFGNTIPGGFFGGGSYNSFTISAAGGPGLAVFPSKGFSVHVAMNLGYDRRAFTIPGVFQFGINSSFVGLFSIKKKGT